MTPNLPATFHKLAENGAPDFFKLNPWCDVYQGEIKGHTLDLYEGRADKVDARLVCPPAVKCAIIAFARELGGWCEGNKKWFRCSIEKYKGEWVAEVSVYNRWFKDSWIVSEGFNTQYAASVALIYAVLKGISDD